MKPTCINMFPIIYKVNDPDFRGKMAAFDYDWTLVNPKEGKTFPTDIEDWDWFHHIVPDKLRQFYDNGYMIVIFTNQSKSWKCDQIKQVASQLDIPLFIVIATDKKDYKPNPDLFQNFVKDFPINKSDSFFVGDALGRKSDFSDSDKKFAENIGISWIPPEDVFISPIDFTLPNIDLSDDPEIIIMIGYPGSGKSSIAKEICKHENYIHIEGDLYKTSSKMMKASIEFIKQKKSIVFDATHSSKKKREEYISFAKKHNYKARCIHVSTSLDTSYKRNKLREDKDQVPKIAYSVYKKHYEEPSEEEGFQLIVV